MITIAMVHYHLRRGGVTRVIQNSIAALQAEPVQIIVVTGEAPAHPQEWSVPVCVVEGLSYAHADAQPTVQTLIDRTQAAVRGVNGGRDPDIWHIHNHALGKNAAWTGAVAGLAAAGQRLLLHIHDFAEDGRPANYRHLLESLPAPLGEILYPGFQRTQVAVLNSRDHRYLTAAGFAAARLHLLPNALPTPPRATSGDGSLILYPTRAIRRKNIGEFLLWSAVQRDQPFGITLAPESPSEIAPYERWKAFAAQQKLPVSFEMGLQRDFHALIESARTLFTTSIAEGFGLAFLEPWLAGKPLAGRDLPEITHEFREAGMKLDHLYAALPIPADWIDREQLRSTIERQLTALRTAYGRDTSTADVAAAVQDACSGDQIEFGHLDEQMQEQVIERVAQSARAATELPAWQEASDCMEWNQSVIERTYGLTQYGQRLMQLYDNLMNAEHMTSPAIDANALLNQFLAPERFRLLRT